MTDEEIEEIAHPQLRDLRKQLRDAEAESDKLLAYAREKLGRRDIHSMYEIVDRLAALEDKIHSDPFAANETLK